MLPKKKMEIRLFVPSKVDVVFPRRSKYPIIRYMGLG